ncbi:MAG: hypothetical protein V4543_00925 [Bacteroidota bacterium]
MRFLKIIIASICLVLSVKASAQDYIPLPDTGSARWVVSYYGWNMGCFVNPGTVEQRCWDSSVSYTLAGHLTIDGLIYNRVNVRNIDYNFFNSGPGINYSVYYRQDKPGRKVYLRYLNNDRDTLLYDFDLSIGDTAKNTLFSSPKVVSYNPVIIGYPVVRDIKYVTIGGIVRRKFMLNYFDDNNRDTSLALIEGIGSTVGFENKSNPCFDPDGAILECGYSVAECFSGEAIGYIRYQHGQCSLTASVGQQIEIEKTGIWEIKQANPLRLNFKPAPDLSGAVTLYSILGVKVFEQEFSTNSEGFELEVPVPGIYNARLTSPAGVSTKTISAW